MGAALKISNIMVHTAENLQMRAFILAFHLLEHILEGYEFNATIEAEEELYKMLVITFLQSQGRASDKHKLSDSAIRTTAAR